MTRLTKRVSALSDGQPRRVLRPIFTRFFSVLDKQPAEMFFYNAGLRRRGYDAPAHPDDYFVAAQVAAQGRSPVPQGQFDADYAYHFDSAKLGGFLRDRAKAKGLTHLIGNVEDIVLSEYGDISHVVTDVHGELSGDIFVDCTGFRAALINKALGCEYRSYQDMLFNDRAVALPTQIDTVQPLVAQTRSVALSNGWMWNIPLQSRYGNGYVYASDYISEDQAETELRTELGILETDVEARHLKMRIGRLDNHWHRNCLAVGLSQGFIEPLEATALMLVQFTIERFIKAQQQPLSIARQDFNAGLNTTFDGVRDYIVAHYALNNRTDSQYWLDNASNPNRPDVLRLIQDCWSKGGDVEKVLTELNDKLVYLRPSWYCILAGMGCFPENLATTSQVASVCDARNYCQSAAQQYFSDHRQMLASY